MNDPIICNVCPNNTVNIKFNPNKIALQNVFTDSGRIW